LDAPKSRIWVPRKLVWRVGSGQGLAFPVRASPLDPNVPQKPARENYVFRKL